ARSLRPKRGIEAALLSHRHSDGGDLAELCRLPAGWIAHRSLRDLAREDLNDGTVVVERENVERSVEPEFGHDSSVCRRRWRRMSAFVELSWRRGGSVALSSSGMIRCASCFPSSTPHWSNESMCQITPWVNTLCS